MEGKVAIVTGGSSGMGKAMAKKFAEKGAKVVITGRTVENLEQTKQEIQQQDGQVLCVQMDVRNPEDAKRMVEETKRAFGSRLSRK